MSTGAELARGQRSRIPDGVVASALSVTLAVEGIADADLTAVCLLVDAKEAILQGDQVVHAERGASKCGSVRGEGPGRFSVELARLPSEAARVVVAVGMSEAGRSRGLNASNIRSAVVTVSAGGQEAFVYRVANADLGRETAICLVELYRKDGWRITATGAGFLGGIPSLISRYRGHAVSSPGGGPAPSPGRGRDALPPVRGSTGALLPGGWAKKAEPKVPSCLIPAVGLVVVERAEGAATGTGFMIGPGGYFVTCAHVVREQQSVAIGLDGESSLRPATVVRVDEQGDLALLHLDDRNGVTDWLVLAGAEFTPALGDDLGLLGYPLGGDLGISLTYSQGVINSLRKVDDISVLQVDAGAAPGSSGGPVFRRSDGRVVGVLTSGLTRNPGGMLVNFAVDIRRLWQLGWVT